MHQRACPDKHHSAVKPDLERDNRQGSGTPPAQHPQSRTRNSLGGKRTRGRGAEANRKTDNRQTDNWRASQTGDRHATRPAAMVDAGASPLQLQRVVGFSGDVPSSLLAHPNGEAVVYGVGSVIVVERINGKRQQRLLQGHTAKVQVATAWMPPVANLLMPEWLALWGALIAWVWLRIVDNNEEAAVRYDKTLYGDPVQPFSLHPGHFPPQPSPRLSRSHLNIRLYSHCHARSPPLPSRQTERWWRRGKPRPWARRR